MASVYAGVRGHHVYAFNLLLNTQAVEQTMAIVAHSDMARDTDFSQAHVCNVFVSLVGEMLPPSSWPGSLTLGQPTKRHIGFRMNTEGGRIP